MSNEFTTYALIRICRVPKKTK